MRSEAGGRRNNKDGLKMSYFNYSVSEYSSSPVTRTYRSSSVERSSSTYTSGIRYSMRATDLKWG